MEGDFDTSELTIDEQVEFLMEDLPAPIQNFLRSPERDRVSLSLAQKYNLHADTAGAFERAYIFMLLGIFTPDEFVEALREGGIDEETIKGLASDVNEMVFKRLREEERLGPGAVPPAAPPATPVMQVGERPVPPPVAPPPPPPAPESTPVPVPTPIYSVAAPIVASTDPHPYLRTMAADMQMAAQGFHAGPATPAQSFQTASIPVTFAAPPVYQAPPPPAPSTPAPPFSAPVTAPVRLTPVDRTHQSAPITKEFGTDPYREPIE